MNKFDEKVLKSLEACILTGKDSDECLDEVMEENKIEENKREELKKELLEYSESE